MPIELAAEPLRPRRSSPKKSASSQSGCRSREAAPVLQSTSAPTRRSPEPPRLSQIDEPPRPRTRARSSSKPLHEDGTSRRPTRQPREASPPPHRSKSKSAIRVESDGVDGNFVRKASDRKREPSEEHNPSRKGEPGRRQRTEKKQDNHRGPKDELPKQSIMDAKKRRSADEPSRERSRTADGIRSKDGDEPVRRSASGTPKDRAGNERDDDLRRSKHRPSAEGGAAAARPRRENGKTWPAVALKSEPPVLRRDDRGARRCGSDNRKGDGRRVSTSAVHQRQPRRGSAGVGAPPQSLGASLLAATAPRRRGSTGSSFIDEMQREETRVPLQQLNQLTMPHLSGHAQEQRERAVDSDDVRRSGHSAPYGEPVLGRPGSGMGNADVKRSRQSAKDTGQPVGRRSGGGNLLARGDDVPPHRKGVRGGDKAGIITRRGSDDRKKGCKGAGSSTLDNERPKEAQRPAPQQQRPRRGSTGGKLSIADGPQPVPSLQPKAVGARPSLENSLLAAASYGKQQRRGSTGSNFVDEWQQVPLPALATNSALHMPHSIRRGKEQQQLRGRSRQTELESDSGHNSDASRPPPPRQTRPRRESNVVRSRSLCEGERNGLTWMLHMDSPGGHFEGLLPLVRGVESWDVAELSDDEAMAAARTAHVRRRAAIELQRAVRPAKKEPRRTPTKTKKRVSQEQIQNASDLYDRSMQNTFEAGRHQISAESKGPLNTALRPTPQLQSSLRNLFHQSSCFARTIGDSNRTPSGNTQRSSVHTVLTEDDTLIGSEGSSPRKQMLLTPSSHKGSSHSAISAQKSSHSGATRESEWEHAQHVFHDSTYIGEPVDSLSSTSSHLKKQRHDEEVEMLKGYNDGHESDSSNYASFEEDEVDMRKEISRRGRRPEKACAVIPCNEKEIIESRRSPRESHTPGSINPASFDDDGNVVEEPRRARRARHPNKKGSCNALVEEKATRQTRQSPPSKSIEVEESEGVEKLGSQPRNRSGRRRPETKNAGHKQGTNEIAGRETLRSQRVRPEKGEKDFKNASRASTKQTVGKKNQSHGRDLKMARPDTEICVKNVVSGRAPAASSLADIVHPQHGDDAVIVDDEMSIDPMNNFSARKQRLELSHAIGGPQHQNQIHSEDRDSEDYSTSDGDEIADVSTNPYVCPRISSKRHEAAREVVGQMADAAISIVQETTPLSCQRRDQNSRHASFGNVGRCDGDDAFVMSRHTCVEDPSYPTAAADTVLGVGDDYKIEDNEMRQQKRRNAVASLTIARQALQLLQHEDDVSTADFDDDSSRDVEFESEDESDNVDDTACVGVVPAIVIDPQSFGNGAEQSDKRPRPQPGSVETSSPTAPPTRVAQHALPVGAPQKVTSSYLKEKFGIGRKNAPKTAEPGGFATFDASTLSMSPGYALDLMAASSDLPKSKQSASSDRKTLDILNQPKSSDSSDSSESNVSGYSFSMGLRHLNPTVNLKGIKKNAKDEGNFVQLNLEGKEGVAIIDSLHCGSEHTVGLHKMKAVVDDTQVVPVDVDENNNNFAYNKVPADMTKKTATKKNISKYSLGENIRGFGLRRTKSTDGAESLSSFIGAADEDAVDKKGSGFFNRNASHKTNGRTLLADDDDDSYLDM